MHVLASPVEPADGLGTWAVRMLRAEMGAMVYDMFCGLVVLWNAGVRGARLLLAVARGAQNAWALFAISDGSRVHVRVRPCFWAFCIHQNTHIVHVV
jgi:hypothetical protein